MVFEALEDVPVRICMTMEWKCERPEDVFAVEVVAGVRRPADACQRRSK